MQHFPVLLDEVLDGLQLKEGGVIIDGTLGAGGHSKEILKRIGAEGRLIGIDADITALRLSQETLSDYTNVDFCHGNYFEFDLILKEKSISQIDGMLMDLGVSSMQLDQAHRGFSFRDELDGDLDMRMNPDDGVSAAEYLSYVKEGELSRIIKEYGEERFHNRVAKAICQFRNKKRIESTKELADIIRASIPGKKGRIDKATRSFQAIRIAVNKELEVLEGVIPKIVSCMKPGGRLAIISFHSLEDRIVKWSFKHMADAKIAKIISKKPILPTDEECDKNTRSRSAKLRVLEKL